MMSLDPMTRMSEVLRSALHQHGIGGAAWGVSLAGERRIEAAGWADLAHHRRPLAPDALFRIASITKPLAAVLALQLVHEGRIGLDEPLDEVLPEFAKAKVLIDSRGPIDGPTQSVTRPLTLRDLLSFRCGWGMDFDFSVDQPVLARLQELGVGPGPKGAECASQEFLDRVVSVPMAEQPGEIWRYHTGSDLAGVVVERLCDQSLDEVLRTRLTEPLGMVDTAFWVTGDRLDRLGDARGHVEGTTSIWDRSHGRWSVPPPMCSAASGLVSTVSDLLRFGEALLGDDPGALGLSEALRAEMCRDQLSSAARNLAQIDPTGAEMGWGLGIGVYGGEAGAWPPPNSVGWSGGLGSRFLAIPALRAVAVVLLTDNFEVPGVIDTLNEAVAALESLDGPTMG